MDDRKRIFPPSREDRRASRIECDVVARIISPSNWPVTRVIDVSRTGIRLGVAIHDDQVREEFGLDRLAQMMQSHLKVNLIIDLGPDEPGKRIRRGLRVVRIGPHREEEGCVELGCELLPSLDDEEACALALRLPHGQESVRSMETRLALRGTERRDWDCKRAPGVRRAARQRDPAEDRREVDRVPRPGGGTPAASGLHVSVKSRRRQLPPVLLGRPLEFSTHGGYAWVDTDACEFRMELNAPLADRVVAFTRAYGAVVDLRVNRGVDEVWTGAVRIVSVGMMPEVPGRLVLGFMYGRPLDAWEMRSLGIGAAIATTPGAS